ncbi:hypothetical protein LTR86_004706 [Recurvomyces mirabilis]|nr:hypothetical protein LTR86_004706 [Recurvomyces mirabilis]
MDAHHVRPATPQALLHRLPDKPKPSRAEVSKPSKFVILIAASTAVAGKVQIARSVSTALGCPLFQGDSLHETAAKAAGVGAPAPAAMSSTQDDISNAKTANEPRYQRMWLSKMTRTGLLFPSESHPANSGFSGFGGTSSPSTSRRSSISSAASHNDTAASDCSMASSSTASDGSTRGYTNRPPLAALSNEARLRHENPALLVLTHPELESWHKRCIRHAVGEYGIGVIFVPLDDDSEPPSLQILNPQMFTQFTSLEEISAARKSAPHDWSDEITLGINVEAKVEEIANEVVEGVRKIICA